MPLYSFLAEHYDEIFPVDPDVVAFVRTSVGGRPAAALDVGCATGGLARELARSGWHVTGIDLDEEMIRLAGAGASAGLRFLQADMLKLDGLFPARSFDLILCLGNTLVHLESEAAVAAFLAQAHALLAPGGRLLLQIMNYDGVAAGKLPLFAPLETSGLIFERSYAPRPDGRLDFHIRLLETPSGRIQSGVFPLLPLAQGVLENLLCKAGFGHPDFFGDFQGRDWDADSRLLVVRCAGSAL
jgi:glycine/sarcosine N-methyltransferase